MKSAETKRTTKRIHLVDTRAFEVGAVVIVEAPSGVEYGNQVGGMACLQLYAEGYFVPIPDLFDLPHDQRMCWGDMRPTPADYAERVDALFRAAGLPFVVRQAAPATECWIPIVIVGDGSELWKQFVGWTGIYTTAENCD